MATFFTGYISTLYNNGESTVLNNGNSCNGFKIQGGVRQGYPLSAYLFIIALDTLANKIRNDKIVKCIKIDNKRTKNKFASWWYHLADLNSVKRSMEILKCYTKCDGLIINVEKT